ncbi:MAG: glycosyltransferase [Candidatus Rokuibacteriota bacterium]
MKALLMIAYHYPPEGGSSGVLRTLKFSKYLPHHGWSPHVLTLRESLYRVRDEALTADVPREVTIHRTWAFDTSRHFAFRRHYPAALTVPDRFLTWLPFGVARGLRVIRRAGIRALYSTSPQPTAHLIGLSLKTLTGLPWIADFRDPWVEEGVHPSGSLRHGIDSRLERMVVERADRVVTTTPYLRGDFLARYPRLSPEKVEVIYNGFDEADVVDLGVPAKPSRFEILHAGLVTAEYRNPAPLFEAVSRSIGAGRVPRNDIRIVFLGGGKYTGSPQFADLVRRFGLGDVVEVAARVSHRDAFARVRQAGCLLVLQASEDTRSLIPAKVFECLRSGRPIIALAPEGATAELLKDMDHCAVVDPADIRRLEGVVAAVYEEWRDSASPVVVSRLVARFERAALTGELARILGTLSPEVARGG